ncbi:MAG: transporter substrate-binding domain-containing protein [Gemmatimonadaceae bacterium]|nr:transporter substrate-binding domain-containing protein [Acetobacteraceae bacterium]
MTEASPEIRNELVPSGKLRATINLGNVVLAQQDASTGALGGVSVDLARDLARWLGVEAELFPFDTAGKAFAALKAGACDVGFLAIEPVRAADLAFTAPYVVIEGTYLVPAASPLRAIADVDRDGVRIAAGKNTAYDLYLSRSLRHAKLVYAPSSRAAIELCLAGETDAVAGVRQPLVAAAAATPGFRVMDGRFQAINQAMAVLKSRVAGAAYLHGFVEAMKVSGFVAAALARSGQSEVAVAPAA